MERSEIQVMLERGARMVLQPPCAEWLRRQFEHTWANVACPRISLRSSELLGANRGQRFLVVRTANDLSMTWAR
jgi:hypothetical protein